MKVVIERFISKTKSIYNFLLDKKYLVVFFLFVSILIIFIGRSLAALTPVSSITVPSTVLSYSDKEEGSWQYTKSAHWISNNQARIDIELNTTMKKNTNYTDIILVIDNSKRMVRSRMTPVQQYVSEFIDSAVVDGNKMSIITFNDNAFAETDFTDDTSALQDSLYNMAATGGSSYYQALLAVDSLLSSYNKEANRDCVVIFLAGSLPTVDTPNEVGEYNYLKSKYNYLNINAIQYDLADGVLDDVKNISDVQYVVGADELLDALNDASVVADNYDKLIFTDYLDTNYFNLNGISKITTSFGTATINNNKVVWNLNGMESGKNAKLSIDINLNNDLVGVEGIYPTHTTADVLYKIGKADTTESTSKTTVLKDNYTVFYEANSPSGCIVSNMPSSKNYLVFDTVQLEDKIPECIGYQFKGWKIVNSGVKKFNDDSFSMPEENVTLRATWKKLSITKSMDGTVHKGKSLYTLIANDSIGLDTNVDFSTSPTSANSGIYTRKGTENDEYPVYYYRGSVSNNNVYFAGLCWKMVRTTSTGGVKLIYNGTAEDINESVTIMRDDYTKVSNDSTYPYSYNSATNEWTSTNKTNSKTGTISFSVVEDGTYILSYSVSSEANYDKAYFYKDGTEIGVYSGTTSGTISLGSLTSSNVIMVKYTKDNSNSSGTDSVTFSIGKATGNTTKKCNNTGSKSQIGTSQFNDRSYLATAGYMYGEKYYDYFVRSYADILTREFLGPNTYYFGTSVTYSNGKYTLNNTVQRKWSDYYNNMSGYYTCGLMSNNGCSKVYYIAGGDSTYLYGIALTYGDTSPTSKTVTLGRSATENSDGTFTLKSTTTIRRTNWFNNYSNYVGYYVCDDLTSTTCDSRNLITSTENYRLTYDDTYKYLFGNDVTWNGSKYVLKDTFTSTNLWETDRKTIAKKYHYTCFNTKGECTSVSYLLDFDDSYYFTSYLVLNDGKNIEDAKNEMFSNSTSSAIKTTIDSWYETNMLSYTEKLEDTPWCNDRTFSFGSLVGKDEDASNGESVSVLGFGSYDRIHNKHNPNIVCSNTKRDGFTVSTSSGGNGALTYPVGLLTADEAMLAGGTETENSNYYLYTGQEFFTSSPSFNTEECSIDSSGKINVGAHISSTYGVRPAISLAPGTVYSSGNGTSSNPYVIAD